MLARARELQRMALPKPPTRTTTSQHDNFTINGNIAKRKIYRSHEIGKTAIQIRSETANVRTLELNGPTEETCRHSLRRAIYKWLDRIL